MSESNGHYEMPPVTEPVLEDNSGSPDVPVIFTARPWTLVCDDGQGGNVIFGSFNTREDAHWYAAKWRSLFGRPTSEGDPFKVVPTSEVMPF